MRTPLYKEQSRDVNKSLVLNHAAILCSTPANGEVPRARKAASSRGKSKATALRTTHQLIRTRLPLGLTMYPARRVQLVKRRAVSEASLTRLQNFIEASDIKINEIELRLTNCQTFLINMNLHRTN